MQRKTDKGRTTARAEGVRPARVLLVLAWAALLPATAQAVDFRLRWQPSATANVVGYNVYGRQSTTSYGAPQDAGLPAVAGDGSMTFTVTGLAAGPRYCFSVSARTDDPFESARSNEICSCTASAECDDGNPCNGSETCQAGSCRAGTAPSCDDGNACTSDTCNPASGCVNTLIAGCQACTTSSECADTNPCNGTEVCTSGRCAPGSALTCNDGNACTTDGCNPASGCTATPIPGCTPCGTGTCGDNNPCNGVEVCQGTTCVPGTPPNCSDANACTADTCSPTSGCLHTPIAGCTPCGTGTCGDGNPCNGTETCQGTTCVPGTPPDCGDGNICTADTCNPTSGCVHTVVSGCQPCTTNSTCTDGNACNGVETCVAGRCVAGTAPSCGDGNLCTIDACNPATGCTNTLISGCVPCGSGVCGDANPCNGAEVCQGTVCIAGSLPDCSDGNGCTADGCTAPRGCTHSLIPGCQACTTSSSCDNGDPCDGIETCQENTCEPGPPLDCNDGDPCTADTCTAAGCAHQALAVCIECQSALGVTMEARRISLVPSIYGIRMTAQAVITPLEAFDPTVSGVLVEIVDASGPLFSVFVEPSAIISNRAGTTYKLRPKTRVSNGADRLGKLSIRVRADGSMVVTAKGVAGQRPSSYPTQLTWMLMASNQCALDSCLAYERSSDCSE